jgi:AbiV family abortive infection protein
VGKAKLNIPVEDLDKGAKLARDNAWQFLRDAELLSSHGSYGHAIALALYGLEEHAKMWALMAMRIEPALRDDLSERIAMRKHVEKFMVALDAVRAERGVEVTEQVRQQVIDTAKKLQSLKERGLYVDYYKKWLTPDSADLKTRADTVVSETHRLMNALETSLL